MGVAAQFRFNLAEARGGQGRTTVMIKNVPNKYTQRMLLDTFNRRFRWAPVYVLTSSTFLPTQVSQSHAVLIDCAAVLRCKTVHM